MVSRSLVKFSLSAACLSHRVISLMVTMTKTPGRSSDAGAGEAQ